MDEMTRSTTICLEISQASNLQRGMAAVGGKRGSLYDLADTFRDKDLILYAKDRNMHTSNDHLSTLSRVQISQRVKASNNQAPSGRISDSTASAAEELVPEVEDIVRHQFRCPLFPYVPTSHIPPVL
ncbi:hypothetical protein K449DRAFT_427644 [Hypoxylon sp. EC38]|nr:hypothetical protein K449DRAFT_427644 [Hypoxylon sp. EC38]